jgi:hypothetical protein
MVGSGLVLWTVKRRTKLPDPSRPHFGFRLVEKLNIATIAGFPAGIATYFLANRLLPLGLGDRADHEIDSLFLAWLAVFAWALVRPSARAWPEMLGLTAALFAAVPLVNGVTTSRGLPMSLLAGDWLFVSFDLVMLVLAAGFAKGARRAARKRAEGPRPIRRKSQEAVAA